MVVMKKSSQFMLPLKMYLLIYTGHKISFANCQLDSAEL